MIAHPHVSVAAKYGAILARNKGPVVRLRDSCRQARRRMSEARLIVQAGLSSPPLACGARYDLPLTLRMMAPSTRRSRKAMAKGPSAR
jgi:hypothetical protein